MSQPLDSLILTLRRMQEAEYQALGDMADQTCGDAVTWLEDLSKGMETETDAKYRALSCAADALEENARLRDALRTIHIISEHGCDNGCRDCDEIVEIASHILSPNAKGHESPPNQNTL